MQLVCSISISVQPTCPGFPDCFDLLHGAQSGLTQNLFDQASNTVIIGPILYGMRGRQGAEANLVEIQKAWRQSKRLRNSLTPTFESNQLCVYSRNMCDHLHIDVLLERMVYPDAVQCCALCRADDRRITVQSNTLDQLPLSHHSTPKNKIDGWKEAMRPGA